MNEAVARAQKALAKATKHFEEQQEKQNLLKAAIQPPTPKAQTAGHEQLPPRVPVAPRPPVQQKTPSRPTTSPRKLSRTKSVQQPAPPPTSEPCALFVRVFAKHLQEWQEVEKDVKAIRDTWSDELQPEGNQHDEAPSAATGPGSKRRSLVRRSSESGTRSAGSATGTSERISQMLAQQIAEDEAASGHVTSRADVERLAAQALSEQRGTAQIHFVTPQLRVDAIVDVYRKNVNAAQTFLRHRVQELKVERGFNTRGSSARRERVEGAINEAVEEYSRVAGVQQEEVPYNVVKIARNNVMREIEKERCHKTTVEELKIKNRQREETHQRLFAKVEEERRQHVEKAIRRHDELVAVAQERRDEALRSEAACQWVSACALAFFTRKIQRNFLMQRTLIQLTLVHGCMSKYFTKLLGPAMERTRRNRRRLRKGRLIFALVAVRFSAWLTLRRKGVSLIVRFHRHVRQANVVKLAVRTFTTRFRHLQRSVRAFLVFRKMRIGLLMHEWVLVEGQLQQRAFDRCRAAIARDRLPSTLAPQAKQAARAAATSRSPKGAAAKQTKVDATKVKVDELVSTDFSEYTIPIPLSMRLPAIANVWSTFAQHFGKFEEPLLRQRDAERYQAQLASYQALPMHKKMHIRKPHPPAHRKVPPFCPAAMMIESCHNLLENWYIALRAAKQQAAKECVVSNTEYDYVSVRNKLYEDIVQRYRVDQTTEQRLELATACIKLSQLWSEALEKAVTTTVDAMPDECLQRNLQALPTGEAFLALVPTLSLPNSMPKSKSMRP